MKTIIFVMALLAHGAIYANALEEAAVPVQEGGNYILWYDAPANSAVGLKERRSFVHILEVRGCWVRAEQYFSKDFAEMQMLIDGIESDSEVGRRVLSDTGMTREEILKEVGAKPIPKDQHMEVWINLQRVEAITKHELHPRMTGESGAGQAAGETAPDAEGAGKPQTESKERSR